MSETGGSGLVLAHAAPGDLPLPLTPERLFTTWQIEALPLLTVILTGLLYLYGVHRLRSRGDAWSPWRTLSFLLGGLGCILIATQSALAAYDTVLISVHMAQHMVLNMGAAIFLVLGAPITLALRTLPGPPRQVLLAALHSRVARVLTFPVVAGLIFVVNPVLLYATGLYEATLRSGWLHDANHLHFVLVGVLWFTVVIGVDPLPYRPPHGMRLLAVFATMPIHALMGVTIMSSETVLAESWYAGLGRVWGPSPLEDQEIAGGILWGTGDLVALLVFGALFVQWARASEREAVREDRRLDRLEAQADAAAGSVPPRRGTS